MSYANMDHAAWVQMNNAATNQINRKRKHWERLPEQLSPFQAKVADIVGMVFGGAYNAPINWETVDWDYGRGVSFVLRWSGMELATFDADKLTKLVFLCHEARIRCSVSPGGFRSLRLSFWQRTEEGSIGRRHPNLDEAVTAFRQYLPADHRVLYRAPPETIEAAPSITEEKEPA